MFLNRNARGGQGNETLEPGSPPPHSRADSNALQKEAANRPRKKPARSMTFGHPYFLLLLLLLPVAAWLKGKRGQPPAFVYSSVQLVRAILNVSRTRSGGLLAALRWLTLALLIVALAQPRLTRSETKVNASGMDIVVAIDMSGSMASEDFVVGGSG